MSVAILTYAAAIFVPDEGQRSNNALELSNNNEIFFVAILVHNFGPCFDLVVK